MKKSILFALAFSLMIAGTAWAQKPLKIGVVDMQVVVNKSEPGQQSVAMIEKKFKPEADKLQQMKMDLEKKAEELDKQRLMLSQDALADKQMDLRRLGRDFQDGTKDLERKLGTEQKRLSDPILEVLGQVIKDYATQNGYTMIVDVSNVRGMPPSAFIYVDESVDITNKIIVELNRAWRARGEKK